MKYLFFVIALLYSGASSAQDAWACEDAKGHRYRSSQQVPSDNCVKLEHGVDLEFIKFPQRTNPMWGVEAFCKAQKRDTCEPGSDGLEHGALNGEWFRLFADSAVVAGAQDAMPDSWTGGVNWSINCSRDKMTSARSCMVYKGDLYIFVKSGGKISVSVGDDHFPQSQTSIKIGPKRFDTTNSDGYFANGSQLVALMRNGTPVVTRYMKWPYRTWIDEEFTSYGAATALQVARWIIAKGAM